MSDIDPDFAGDVGPTPPAEKCLICGKPLSRYNRTGQCFHHPDAGKERRQQEIASLREKAERRVQAREIGDAERARLRQIATDHKIESEESKILAELITQSVCTGLGFSKEEFVAKSRKVELAESRQILMYLLHLDCSLSSVAIGNMLGGRDHTTVLHGITKIEEQIKSDPMLAVKVETIREYYLELLPQADETPPP